MNNVRLPVRPDTLIKNGLLLLLLLVLLIPTVAIGAETHTMSVEFSFNAPDDPAKQLLGYRLYKEGEQICQTDDPTTSSITCEFFTEDGTFNFTLTAGYSDGTESPHSPSFPFTIESTTTDPVTPSPEPPTAIISSSTAAGSAPVNVNFNGTSSTAVNASIVSYSWTFGDGAQASGETTSHTFTTAGTYYTELTVVDSQGLSDKISTPIVVTGVAPANEQPIAAIAYDATSTDAPLTFSLNASQSFDPDGSITHYDWTFQDETTASGQSVLYTCTGEGVYTVSLQVTDDRGDTATTSVELDCSTPLPAQLNIEVGEISLNHKWVAVTFANTFSQPVVIAGPPTANGGQPLVVRIRNVTATGFEIRLQEWDYLDDAHVRETLSYMVIEKGTYTLDNGSKLEAGSFNGTSVFSQVPLQQQYDLIPVILTQAVTENETDAVTGRIKNIEQNSFKFKLQEMQATATDHIPETVGYIAWEPGKGEVSGLTYEIGTTAQDVNHKWFDLLFETEFPELPFFISAMQTCAGGDPATVRSQNLSPTATQIKIEEEKSADREVKHIKEVVGYLTIGAVTE